MNRTIALAAASAAAALTAGAFVLAADASPDTGRASQAADAPAQGTPVAPDKAAHVGPLDQPATTPLPAAHSVELGAAGVRVPVPRIAGVDAAQQMRTRGHAGASMESIRFLTPGPIKGSFVGSIQVVSISGVPVPSDLQELAADVDRYHPSSTVQVAGSDVVYWPDVGAIEGTSLGQPDRAVTQYAFPAPEGGAIIEVIFDGVPEADARAYLADLLEEAR